MNALMNSDLTECNNCSCMQIQNLFNPQGLEGLSTGTMLLALTGNALMVPRALLTKDMVWLAGTSWYAV